MVSDVTKLAYNTAKSLMFEQNSNILWINFKAGLTPLLDKLMSGQGFYQTTRLSEGQQLKRQNLLQILNLSALCY